MKKPSVTELLQILDKPALLWWANKQGLLGIDISKKKSEWLNAGSSIHNQIELFILHGTPFNEEEDQKKCVKFLEKYEVLEIEKKIETEYFKGRLDAKIKCKKTGKIYLVDFKRNCKKVYFEHKLQLAAYSMAENCDGLLIIGVPQFKEFDLGIEDFQPYQEIIKSLSNIYTNKKLIENEN
jgi:hypothetical protein